MATRRLEVEFIGDVSNLERANKKLQREVNDLKKQFDDTGTSGRKLGDDTDELGKKIDKTSASAKRVGRDIRGLGDDSDSTGKNIRKLADGFGGRGFGGNLEGVTAGLGPLRGGLGVVSVAALTLGPALLAAGGSAIALTAALAPLVGLAGAGAVAVTSFGQAAGVFALATAGIGDALKEQMDVQDKATKAATSGADQQRAAARAIQSAQDGVRSANEQVRTSVMNLSNAEHDRGKALAEISVAQKQARRDLQDLHASLAQAALTEQSAVLRLTDARKALLQAMHPQDAQKLADAQAQVTTSTLNEQHAVQALTDARKRLADLMKPADALTVADAQDAVADATRDQTRAAIALADAQAAANATNADPTSTDEDKAKAALALADAQNAVGDAARATTHAQQQLAAVQAGPDPDEVAKAKQDIADAEQGVADATTATAKAQQALVDARKGPDPQDVAKARLEVAQAEQDLADATRSRVRIEHDASAADQKGISGSDAVVQARERLHDATQHVADAERQLADAHRAVTRAQQGVTDAQLDAKSSTAAAAVAASDLNAKLDALPPAAQAFVKQLISLKPKLDDLRATAASGLFPGVTQGINAAMGSFESVKKVVGETSTVLGGLAARAGELVGSSGFGKDIETIGHRNALIIDRIGRAAIYAADTFRHLIVAAGPLTTWLAKVALEFARGADGAVRTARESGALGDFFQKTRNTLITVVSILGNLGEAFFNVGKAAAPFGRNMLASIEKITARFAAWTNSIGGQHALQDFFRDSTRLASLLVPAIGSAAGSLGGMAFRVLPAYVKLLNLLGPLAGPLVQAFVTWKVAATGASIATGLLTATTKTWTAATKIAGATQVAYTATTGAATGALNALRLSTAATAVGVYALTAAEKISAAATKAWTGAQWLLNAAMDANPIGLVVVAIGALAAGLIYAYKHSETFRDIVNGAFHAIETVAGPVIDWLSNAIPDAFNAIIGAAEAVVGWLGQNWPLVLGILTGPIGLFVVAVTKYRGQVVDAFSALPGLIKDAVFALGGVLVDVGKWMLARVVDGFKAVASGIGQAVKWMIGAYVDLTKAEVSAVKSVGSWVLGTIADGFIAGGKLLAGVGKWLFKQLEGLIHGISADLGDLGSWVIDTLVKGITFVTDKGVSGVTGVGKWLLKQIKDDFNTVKDALGDVGGDIIGWIVGGLEKGAFALQGFLNKIIHLINKLPGVDIPDIKALTKDSKGNVQGFAGGGAFARTGGIVSSPITLMGEEAPRHPEIVVPTNPAHRSRAQQLARMAGRAVGLATGGVYTASKFGGHDDPSAFGRPTASGKIANDSLWGFAELSNPPGSLNFSALGGLPMGTKINVTYNGHTAKDVPKVDVGAGGPGMNGHVRAVDLTYAVAQSLGFPGLGDITVNGKGGGILGTVGHAVSGAVGAVTDLLADGAKALLGALPGTGGLGWLSGLGDYAISKITDWIKGKATGAGQGGVPGASGPGGVGSFNGIPMANWVIQSLNYAQRKLGIALHPTSGYRPGFDPHTASGTSEHQGTQYPHGAVDFGGYHDAAALAVKNAVVNATADFKWPLRAPNGFVDDGHASGTGFARGGVWGGVLGSYEQGTPYVPETGPYLLHKGESVTPVGASPTAASIRVIVHGDIVSDRDDPVEVVIGDKRFTAAVEKRIDENNRETTRNYRAGVGL